MKELSPGEEAFALHCSAVRGYEAQDAAELVRNVLIAR